VRNELSLLGRGMGIDAMEKFLEEMTREKYV
jgi:hypothetical protein